MKLRRLPSSLRQPLQLMLAGGAVLGCALLLSGAVGADAPDRWWSPVEGRVFLEGPDYAKANGSVRTLLVGGPMATPACCATNPPMA